MAARSLFIGISVAAALAMAGCAARPKTCYVTLNLGGQPTAEACETGPVLIVRPITETNAAFYVPPYVLGALSYEGFVAPPEPTADASAVMDDGEAEDGQSRGGEGRRAPNAASALRDALIGEAFLMPLASDPAIPMSDAFVERMPPQPSASLFKAGKRAAPADGDAILAKLPHGVAPPNRIAPEHPRIDGEVRYRRPYEGLPAMPISPDFL
ncbi:hypothetical protein [Jiella avicenniae]|uniref:Conjugal transfer pilus assembly protein TraV n=1 Tax=Jiella avicenniae TaxID=2907202 RepID=A0A9X1P224_9HYPH|nr:hypothetical protein [Jiella avicenniae]MCE7027918.1 hypothetical protein [Jiella avicenniae]